MFVDIAVQDFTVKLISVLKITPEQDVKIMPFVCFSFTDYR